jgi:putative oxidoreductase
VPTELKVDPLMSQQLSSPAVATVGGTYTLAAEVRALGAPAVLRAGLAIVFLAHGSQKLFGALGGGGISGTAQYLASVGAHPGMLWAVLAAMVEFGGGLAMALGLFTRLAAFALALDMALAVYLTNWHNGFFAEKAAGGWEINMILICMAISVALTGAGRFACDHALATRLPANRLVRALFG